MINAIGGSIVAIPTSCLTGLDSTNYANSSNAKQLNRNKINSCQPYSDTSPQVSVFLVKMRQNLPVIYANIRCGRQQRKSFITFVPEPTSSSAACSPPLASVSGVHALPPDAAVGVVAVAGGTTSHGSRTSRGQIFRRCCRRRSCPDKSCK